MTVDETIPPRAHAPTIVRSIRAACGWTTVQLGARLERSGRTIEDWEQGRRYPDRLAWRTLLTLAKRRGLQLDIDTA